MNNCISCIKDGKTGECRDLKDKKAREDIAEITETLNMVIENVNAITGTEGGHLATDEDIETLREEIQNIDMSGKLDKVEHQAGQPARAYIVNSNGQSQMDIVPNEAKQWTIPQRGANGVITTGEPTANNHATTKNYVDTKVNAKCDAVTGVTSCDQVYIKKADGSQGVLNILEASTSGTTGIPNSAYVEGLQNQINSLGLKDTEIENNLSNLANPLLSSLSTFKF